jgi:hypothetical protein
MFIESDRALKDTAKFRKSLRDKVMSEVPKYDEKLWFTMGSHCEGKHYLLGNPHTFVGRMLAWCSQKEVSFFVSKSAIDECSVEAKYWIEGFLKGNEPEPPTNENSDMDFESEDYKNWLEKIEEFRQIGVWKD